jgi:hypothetical protein
MTGVMTGWANRATLTPDGRCYASHYARELASLYRVTGVR